MGPIPEEPISPELVLVDPVLRDRLLRESLQELLLSGVDTPLVGQRPRVAPPTRETQLAVATVTALPGSLPARRRGRARGSSLAAVVLVALFLALPSLAFLPPRQAPELAPAPEPTLPSEGTTIAWQPDPTADYYVFELSLDGRLVQLETVRVPSVRVRAALPPGRYTWRILAGEGQLADHDTRGPIAGGTVVLE